MFFTFCPHVFLAPELPKNELFFFLQCDSVPPSLVITMHLHQCQKYVYSAGLFSEDVKGTSLFNMTLAFHKLKYFFSSAVTENISS